MKKTIAITFVFAIFYNCANKEENIAKLIKNDMFENLYDFSSYEPISTKIDSAITSIFRDSLIISYISDIQYHDKLKKGYITKLENNQERIKLFSKYKTGEKYNWCKEAKINYDNNLKLAKKENNIINEIVQKIQVRAKKIETTPLFIGWEAIQKFRCKSQSGVYDIYKYRYIISPNLKEIIFKEDMRNNEYIESMKSILTYTTIDSVCLF